MNPEVSWRNEKCLWNTLPVIKMNIKKGKKLGKRKNEKTSREDMKRKADERKNKTNIYLQKEREKRWRRQRDKLAEWIATDGKVEKHVRIERRKYCDIFLQRDRVKER